MENVIRIQAAVVGSGAAGLNAALRLHQYGVENIAILTEAMTGGTSRNAGSDKQTYYKMSLCGDAADSPAAMAQDLFAGQCVDGDNAYAEAALSVPCFLHLAELGVEFPTNRMGEYVGYRTDHDTRSRATSAGPLTSKMMSDCLEKAVMDARIPIYDKVMVVEILKEGERAVGLIALDLSDQSGHPRFLTFQCGNIIWATGGPAVIYADTVFPLGHYGSSGVPFSAGVKGSNLTEWQYGMASLKPRWNVSGTYMQVIPRIISIDKDGAEREFVLEHYDRMEDALSMIFQKGYEWPFDSRKAHAGSSVLDLLVYRERVLLGRRVFLDYRRNPGDLESLPYEALKEEAFIYLRDTGACFGTPIERLLHMNRPAYEFYLSKGVDLRTEPLEIALCAQHNNGGLSVDCWWQTNISHFFAAGEVAGSHGVFRPGGSALNAGQVGSMRAAQYIAFHPTDAPLDKARFDSIAETAMQRHISLCNTIRSDSDTAAALLLEAQKQMSSAAGAVRSVEAITILEYKLQTLMNHFPENIRVISNFQLAYRLKDALTAQIMYLAAMEDYYAHCHCSRGSALYTDADGTPLEKLDDLFRFLPDTGSYGNQVQEVQWRDGKPIVSWRHVRPLPQEQDAFETVWRNYREHRNVG